MISFHQITYAANVTDCLVGVLRTVQQLMSRFWPDFPTSRLSMCRITASQTGKRHMLSVNGTAVVTCSSVYIFGCNYYPKIELAPQLSLIETMTMRHQMHKDGLHSKCHDLSSNRERNTKPTGFVSSV